MAKLHSTPSNQRFSWLNAPAVSTAANGPWILSENKAVTSQSPADCWVNLPAKTLLTLLGSGLTAAQSQSATILATTHDHAHSTCGRFEIRRLRQLGDSARLFVQQRDDYFQRLELYVENELIAAFNEPVWPHLQQSAISVRVSVPAACIQFLEFITAHKTETETQTLCESANQADIGKPDEAVAAA